jgi:hypothetical protein
MELEGSSLDTTNRAAAIQRFVAQFPDARRGEAIHLALRALRARTEPDRVLACELAWEVHTRGYWSQLRSEDGRPYESEESYFRDVLGLTSWRTAYKRLAIGRMVTSFEEAERAAVRTAIAQVGVAKAAAVVPAIERLGQWSRWLQLARELSLVVLQAQVSAALQSAPRGREQSPPGERFRRTILAAMPDIEALELVDRYFALGARVVGTGHPIAIFLAGCRECLAEWEVQVAQGRIMNVATSRGTGRRDENAAGLDEADRPEKTDAHVPPAAFCPQGQTGNGHAR